MSRPSHRVPRQRGVALLVALLVVALATVLIASLLDRGELSLARTRNQLRESQAEAYAQGLEAYAARVLQQDWALNGGGADSNASMWAVPLPPTPVPSGLIAATMRDRNGCFNLNNLVDAGGSPNPQWLEKFRRLLTALRLDPNLADAVSAWLNPGPGNDDPYYLAQAVAYRQAKQQFIHVSELRLVKGVSGDAYAALAPHVCALPRGSRINVNTASVPVLMTLGGVTTAELAQRVWQEGHANYPDLAALQSIVPGIQAESPYYGVSSSYFQARGDITLDGQPFTFYSLIERRLGSGADGGIRVIARGRGSDE
ncbi:MAG TPA: type II secretion system minor pseudopilin GspK [Rhodanobacteraceae bacterium]|jgi:general secretion pathway protein K|nr:type II secretion system minor pseudopilin GspK [Rhodanobacteraceae bacterium]